MKFSKLKAFTRYGVLALILTFAAAFPAFAQNSRNDNARDDRRTETTRVVEQDNDTDLGWIG
ncbi:MAG: hypothetical protein JWN60_2019, partial [Acidobacteria bacterium]|nr:hypothetical protein [Acidobacteriota bacterium]